MAQALGDGRLAVAGPDVPAGKYARASLIALGVWDGVQAKLAPADNVRGALLFVARGETPLGIVYDTDARIEPKVRIVGLFPDESSADCLSRRPGGRLEKPGRPRLPRLPRRPQGRRRLPSLWIDCCGAPAGETPLAPGRVDI